MKTAYEMAVNNCAVAIRENGATSKNPAPNAFACSEVLAIAFCKAKEEVIGDIINIISVNIEVTSVGKNEKIKNDKFDGVQ